MFKVRLRPTDTLFSKYIRNRDNWTCQRCRRQYEVGSQGLHCSHYWSRGKENTRFDEENCIALCFGCHQIWGHGDGKEEYTAFMIEKLGQAGFDLLRVRAHTRKAKNDKMDKIVIKELLRRQAEG